MFSSSDHHRPVWREAVLLHGSDHRPVVVVRVHRRRGAAVGTGEARNRNRRRPEKGKKNKKARRGGEKTVATVVQLWQLTVACQTLPLLPQGYHHNHRHGNELGTWKQRDSCLRARRENKPSVSIPLWIDARTQTRTHTQSVRKHALCWGEKRRGGGNQTPRSLAGSVGGQTCKRGTAMLTEAELISALWIILEVKSLFGSVLRWPGRNDEQLWRPPLTFQLRLWSDENSQTILVIKKYIHIQLESRVRLEWIQFHLA